MNKNKVTKPPEINEYKNAFDTGLTKLWFLSLFSLIMCLSDIDPYPKKGLFLI